MTEYFVSNFGLDSYDGLSTTPILGHGPFKTINHGISVLTPGDILSLLGEVFVESVDIGGKNGTPTEKIVIRSRPGEHAYIDGSLTQFRTPNPTDWIKNTELNAHPDEYISAIDFPEGLNNRHKVVNRGAFLDRDPYTRLITYSHLEDLRAENQTFEGMALTDPRPGFDPPPGATVAHPWVYMGPGIWYNTDLASPLKGHVHIRLSHTSNNIAGLEDYSGAIDPREIGLAITTKDTTALFVHVCHDLRFENLTIRFGGEWSVNLNYVQHIEFSHVCFWASNNGIRMEGKEGGLIHPLQHPNKNITFHDCQFNGGTPPWFFRNDKKNSYEYLDGNGNLLENHRGDHTVDKLLMGHPMDTGTQIYRCEFFNGHDVYLVGDDLSFHHNWLNNMGDDGLFVDAFGANERMKIYQNVILKTLTAISFRNQKESISPPPIDGNWFIYRNLIDLRQPTAARRPRYVGDTAVWRHGDVIMANPPVGAYDLFQNTLLVYNEEGESAQASFTHYDNTSNESGCKQRRSLNNIFIAVDPYPDSNRAITFIPSPRFPAQADPAQTDGNNYFRMGFNERPHYRSEPYGDTTSCEPGPGPSSADDKFDSLEAGADPLRPNSQIFLDSGSLYEANSIEWDPQFRRIGGAGLFSDTDDLRLGNASPAIGAGVSLPPDLQALDLYAPSGSPDIGCYPFGSGPLRVGVDGLKSYPIN